MNKEQLAILESCQKRMQAANDMLNNGGDVNVSIAIWWSAYNQQSAVYKASAESLGIRYTTHGDFSHLQSAPGLHF